MHFHHTDLINVKIWLYFLQIYVCIEVTLFGEVEGWKSERIKQTGKQIASRKIFENILDVNR